MRKKKLPELKITYSQSTDITPEETKRRIKYAYSILFEETLKIIEASKNQLNDDLRSKTLF